MPDSKCPSDPESSISANCALRMLQIFFHGELVYILTQCHYSQAQSLCSEFRWPKQRSGVGPQIDPHIHCVHLGLAMVHRCGKLPSHGCDPGLASIFRNVPLLMFFGVCFSSPKWKKLWFQRRTFSPQNATLNGETKPSLMHGKKPAEGKSKKKRGVGVQKDKSKTHFPRSKVKGKTGGTTSGDRG